MPAPAHWLQVVLRGPNAALPACSGRDGALAWTYDTSTLYTSYSGSWLSVGGGGGSVDIYAGTGITCSPNPITGSGTVSLAVPVTIAHGGTNSTTGLNNQQIMVSQSGMIVEAGAMTQGQLLIGKSGGQPVISTLTAGAGIGIANGGGSITISNLSGAQQTLTSGIYGAASVTSGTLGSGAYGILAGTGITVSQTAANVFTVTNASGTQQTLTSGIYGAASVTSGVLGSGAYGILAGTGITVSQTAANVFTVTNASGTQQTTTSGIYGAGSVTSGTLGSGAYNILAGAGITVSQTAANVFTVTNASGGGGGGAGTVTNVGTGTGLTGGSITTSGVISLVSPVIVANGGTGDTSFTAYTPVCGGTATTSGLQSVASIGTSGQILTSQGSAALPVFAAGGGSFIPGYVYGLPLSYVSTNSMTLGTGYAMDTTNTVMLNLASSILVGTTSGGTQSGGVPDAQALTGTCFTVSGSAVVSGSSTNFLTGFAPGGSPRSITGTVVSGNTTFLSGNLTLFLSQCAVGDLIGNSTAGYSQITAIPSNTQITLASALAVPTGTGVSVIENAVFGISTATPKQIKSITNNTSLTLVANAGITTSGGGWVGQVQPAEQIPCHIWVGNGLSGTTAWSSTQRTTPFGLTGFNTYSRRVGSFIWNGSIIPFTQSSHATERTYLFQDAYDANNEVIVGGGTATSWTTVSVTNLCPPSTNMVLIEALMVVLPNNSYANVTVSIRPQGIGSSTTSRNQYIALSMYSAQGPEEYTSASMMCPPSGGAIDYVCFNPLNTYQVSLAVYGYIESL